MAGSSRRRRRHHSDELKAQVLAECLQPGASLASVAMAHGINADLVHRWRRDAWARAHVAQRPRQVEEFVALPIVSAPAESASGEIRVELRRGALSVSVSWPLAAASSCTAWLRELLS
jgi:transposase